MSGSQAYQKAWREAHAKTRKAYASKYYRSHRLEFAVSSKQWAKDNPQKRKVIKDGSRLKRAYGITLDEYEGLLVKQSGLCAICRKPESAKSRRLAIDHCHATGRVRGLLCMRCNIALGMYEDDALRMRAALEYLERV